jgi:hypothetical protein
VPSMGTMGSSMGGSIGGGMNSMSGGMGGGMGGMNSMNMSSMGMMSMMGMGMMGAGGAQSGPLSWIYKLNYLVVSCGHMASIIGMNSHAILATYHSALLSVNTFISRVRTSELRRVIQRKCKRSRLLRFLLIIAVSAAVGGALKVVQKHWAQLMGAAQAHQGYGGGYGGGGGGYAGIYSGAGATAPHAVPHAQPPPGPTSARQP